MFCAEQCPFLLLALSLSLNFYPQDGATPKSSWNILAWVDYDIDLTLFTRACPYGSKPCSG